MGFPAGANCKNTRQMQVFTNDFSERQILPCGFQMGCVCGATPSDICSTFLAKLSYFSMKGGRRGMVIGQEKKNTCSLGDQISKSGRSVGVIFFFFFFFPLAKF